MARLARHIFDLSNAANQAKPSRFHSRSMDSRQKRNSKCNTTVNAILVFAAFRITIDEFELKQRFFVAPISSRIKRRKIDD
jgi:hypothetical protein